MSPAAAAVLLVTLTVVSATDLKRRIIPNQVLLVAALAAVALSLAGLGDLGGGLLAAGVISFPLLAAALLRPQGMGMGDAKLVALIGLFLGWQALPALLIGLALAGMTGVLMALGSRTPLSRTSLPLAPFLALGALPLVVSSLQPLH
jgi:leader peptidase (prepilin peptidase)/N-methyltransferase